jgi:hypothetical protein
MPPAMTAFPLNRFQNDLRDGVIGRVRHRQMDFGGA